MFIQILVDNPSSWIVPFAKELKQQLIELKHTVVLVHKATEVKKGDILCLLGCETIFRDLDLNKYNLVVHESNLPKGKGWSPLTWQIIEGENQIPIILFEASNEIDSGQIYIRDTLCFEGHELVDELRKKQGEKTVELVMKFIDNYDSITPVAQSGKPTYYMKRGPIDSKLDIEKSIVDQFNLLRICDNEKYPAFFEYMGFKFNVRICKIKEKDC